MIKLCIVNLSCDLDGIKQQKEQVEYQRDTFEPGTPKPVSGRQNIEVQTDEFVETLTDKPPEYEKDT